MLVELGQYGLGVLLTAVVVIGSLVSACSISSK